VFYLHTSVTSARIIRTFRATSPSSRRHLARHSYNRAFSRLSQVPRYELGFLMNQTLIIQHPIFKIVIKLTCHSMIYEFCKKVSPEAKAKALKMGQAQGLVRRASLFLAGTMQMCNLLLMKAIPTATKLLDSSIIMRLLSRLRAAITRQTLLNVSNCSKICR
jgi:hypothetical protein